MIESLEEQIEEAEYLLRHDDRALQGMGIERRQLRADNTKAIRRLNDLRRKLPKI